MRPKEYNVKLYDLAGNYVRTFSQREIMGEIRFSSQTAGWQGELRLKLSVAYDSSRISTNSVVKVFEADEQNPLGRQIYAWYVGNVRRVSEKSSEYVEARVVGLASVLSMLFYKSGASYAFNKNDDPANVIKSVVDSVAATYPWLVTYDGSSVQAYGSNVNLSFSYEKCLSAVKKTAELTDYWWTVDGTGKMYFKPKSAAATHLLTYGKDVDGIEIEENAETVVNEYFLGWASWTASASDPSSQTTNGVRQLFESKTGILDSGTAANAAADYISQNKEPKRRILVTVNSKFDFESINPWDLVTIENMAYQIQGLQILRIEYAPNVAKLELESVRSLPKSILQ